MDYLEGALLGPVWSDTDYENRSHKGAALMVSILFWAGLAYAVLAYNSAALSPWLQTPAVWIPVTAILILVSPVLGFYYYSLPLIIRLVILIIQAAKYGSASLLVYSLLAPEMSLNAAGFFPDLLEWMDSTVGTFVERNTENYELFGLVLSGLAIVVVFALGFILALVLIVLLPILYLQAVKYVQRVFDHLFFQFTRVARRAVSRWRQNQRLAAQMPDVRDQADESPDLRKTDEDTAPMFSAPLGARRNSGSETGYSDAAKPPGTIS